MNPAPLSTYPLTRHTNGSISRVAALLPDEDAPLVATAARPGVITTFRTFRGALWQCTRLDLETLDSLMGALIPLAPPRLLPAEPTDILDPDTPRFVVGTDLYGPAPEDFGVMVGLDAHTTPEGGRNYTLTHRIRPLHQDPKQRPLETSPDPLVFFPLNQADQVNQWTQDLAHALGPTTKHSDLQFTAHDQKAIPTDTPGDHLHPTPARAAQVIKTWHTTLTHLNATAPFPGYTQAEATLTELGLLTR